MLEKYYIDAQGLVATMFLDLYMIQFRFQLLYKNRNGFSGKHTSKRPRAGKTRNLNNLYKSNIRWQHDNK